MESSMRSPILSFCISILIVSLCFSGSAFAEAGSGNSNSNSDLEGTTLATTVVMVVGGGMLAGFIWSSVAMTRSGNEEAAAEELARFLRQNHGSVTRDVLAGQGLFWDQWQVETGLSDAELTTFQTSFTGSKQQTAMLTLLNSPLSAKDAVLFATELVQAAQIALGEKRVVQSFEFAIARSPSTVKKAG